MENKKNNLKDWEINEDYYNQTEGASNLSLEDFINVEEDTFEKNNSNEELSKIALDVKCVMEFAAKGMSTEQIASTLNLDYKYVYNIQVCAQGFHEDDEIAIAHLIMMG